MNNDKSSLKNAFVGDSLTIAHLEKSLTVSHLVQTVTNIGQTQGESGIPRQEQATIQQYASAPELTNQSGQSEPAPKGGKD